MTNVKWLAVLLLAATVTALGCREGAPPANGNGGEEAVEATPVSTEGLALCGMCGQIKGSEACCAEEAVLCEKCGLVEGSPGCCLIEKGEDVALCTDCGQIKGSEACCDPNAEKCEECGLAKGSPGCCAIKPEPTT